MVARVQNPSDHTHGASGQTQAPGSVGFVDVNFNEEMGSSKMDKALIRRKRVLSIDTGQLTQRGATPSVI